MSKMDAERASERESPTLQGTAQQTPGRPADVGDTAEATKATADAGHPKTVREVLETYGFWNRLSPLLPLLDIDADAFVEGFEVEALTGYSLCRIDLPDLRGFGVRMDSGVISGFGDEGEPSQIPKGWKAESRMPSQAILYKAHAVIRALGLSYKVSLSDFRYDDLLNEGFGGWRLSLTPEYQGVKGGGLLNLAFSAYSGKVIRLANVPPIAPKSMTQNISEDDAIQKASGVVNQGEIKYDTAGAAAALCIVYPNGNWGSKIRNSNYQETRLAWRVFFVGEGGDRQAWVDIDAGTGDVIGGGSYL